MGYSIGISVAVSETDASDSGHKATYNRSATTELTGADVEWTKTGELADGVNEDIDLSDLTDEFGNSFAFSKIMAVLILNISDQLDTPTTAPLTIGAAGSNPWVALFSSATHTIDLRSTQDEFVFVDATGLTVSNNSSDILRINNSDGGGDGAQYRIVLIGLKA